MVSWSDLANDVLEYQTGMLSLPDQHRFSAVCHNWRLVARKHRYPPKPQLPWLVLGEDKKTKKRNFFNLSEERHYSIDIPELYGQFICGSSHGWFIAVDIRMNGCLVNPFTRECIQLPPFPPYDETITTCTLEPECAFMQKNLVWKAILSHDPREKPDNFTVMILFGKLKRVAIWRPSDTDWIVINSLQSLMLDIFYFQRQLYAATWSLDYVFVIDLGDIKLGVRQIKTQGPFHFCSLKYLMVLKGKLLVAARFQCYLTSRTNKFVVHAMEKNLCECEVEEGELFPSSTLIDEERWSELGNIDRHAVFVGKNAPILVNPTDFPTKGCITNGIYFSDGQSSRSWQLFGHDFGVYDMDKNTLGQLCSTSTDRDHVCCPFRCSSQCRLPPDAALTWFTPRL